MSSKAHPVDLHVGCQIRKARKEAQLTQSDLAEQLGITFQQVQKYERGMNRTSCSRLYDISQCVNQPIAFFFGTYSGEPDKA